MYFIYCYSLYNQFHTEASLGGFLYYLLALTRESVTLCIGKRRGGHLLHHEVESGDARLFAVGGAMSVTAMSCMLPIITATFLPLSARKTGDPPPPCE